MLEKEKLLMEIKTEIAELHNSILTLSAGLWNISILIDEMLMDDIHHTTYTQDYDRMVDKLDAEAVGNSTTITMEHTEMPPIETPVIKARPKPRRETAPEPPESPAEPDVPDTLPPPPPLPPKASEQPKPSIVERILGREADQKAKLRAERTAKLEKELAELQKAK